MSPSVTCDRARTSDRIMEGSDTGVFAARAKTSWINDSISTAAAAAPPAATVDGVSFLVDDDDDDAFASMSVASSSSHSPLASFESPLLDMRCAAHAPVRSRECD